MLDRIGFGAPPLFRIGAEAEHLLMPRIAARGEARFFTMQALSDDPSEQAGKLDRKAIPIDPGAIPDPVVVILERDGDGRRSLDRLLRQTGYRTILYESATALIDDGMPLGNCCLVLDHGLSGGRDIPPREQPAGADGRTPFIFVSDRDDVPAVVRAMRMGAVDFLVKPLQQNAILSAIEMALACDREQQDRRSKIADLHRRYLTLSQRERQVMALVTQGMMNKQVAGELQLQEITVKLHRLRLMRKLKFRSLSELVRAADLIADAGIA